MVINYVSLYFWIIKTSVSPFKIMEENVSTLFPSPLEIFSDLFPLFKQGSQTSPLPRLPPPTSSQKVGGQYAGRIEVNECP